MIRSIVTTAIAAVAIGCCASAQAQQQTATLKPDGSVVRSTSATASVTGTTSMATTAASTSTKRFVKHEAVKNADGTEEIRLTDTEGKITVISAKPGESVQQKYWDYLKKEGLPCACSADEQPAAPAAAVATRNAQGQVQTTAAPTPKSK